MTERKGCVTNCDKKNIFDICSAAKIIDCKDDIPDSSEYKYLYEANLLKLCYKKKISILFYKIKIKKMCKWLFYF